MYRPQDKHCVSRIFILPHLSNHQLPIPPLRLWLRRRVPEKSSASTFRTSRGHNNDLSLRYLGTDSIDLVVTRQSNVLHTQTIELEYCAVFLLDLSICLLRYF